MPLIRVVKADGTLAPFDPDKVRGTALRAGASPELADRVVREVAKRAYDGIPTKRILAIALAALDRLQPTVAARYDLKGAILRLGPAGFIFERLIADMLAHWGWRTTVHQVIAGRCVAHEVDVTAERDHERAMIEAKYHNQPGIFTGLKDALYVVARFEDLAAAKTRESTFTRPWLATNTKFSGDAIQYAECRGLQLLGWKYPATESIQYMLESKGLYPVTVLRGLDKATLQRLAAAGLMFCSDLLGPTHQLAKRTGIRESKLVGLQKAARAICELPA